MDKTKKKKCVLLYSYILLHTQSPHIQLDFSCFFIMLAVPWNTERISTKPPALNIPNLLLAQDSVVVCWFPKIFGYSQIIHLKIGFSMK